MKKYHQRLDRPGQPGKLNDANQEDVAGYLAANQIKRAALMAEKAGPVAVVERPIVFKLHDTALDYSWCKLVDVEGVASTRPRAGPARVLKQLSDARDAAAAAADTDAGPGSGASGQTVDASSAALGSAIGEQVGTTVTETAAEEQAIAEELKPQILHVATALLLNNNEIASLGAAAQLEMALAPAVPNLSALKWLDLSVNRLTTIGPAIGECCPNLSILYLHANKITDLKEVDFLQPLKELHGLSLHGNPIEADPQPLSARTSKKKPMAPKQLSTAPSTPRAGGEGDAARHRAEYRFHILLAVPSLKKLDFSPLTVLEKENAQIWQQRLEGQKSARMHRER